MTITITPADGSLAVFKLGRSPDKGHQVTDDAGQTVGPTDGAKVFVYQTRKRVKVHSYGVSGITTAEWLAFREYSRDVIKGALESFTFAWGSTSLAGCRLMDATEAFQSREAEGAWDLRLLLRQEV